MTAIASAAYSASVWRRFCAPEHAGRPARGVSGCARDAAHQLEVCFHYLAGAHYFTAVGCPTTIAAADFCAAALDAGERPDARAVMDGLEIARDRAHCVRVCEDAMDALHARLAQAPTGEDQPAP